MSDSNEHYFTSSPKSPYKTQTISVNLAGHLVEVTTANATFSAGHLDRGTEVLLTALPAPPAGNVLDIGCGWGAISLHTGLSAKADTTVWAVDVNERALELTATNALSLDLNNVLVRLPGDVPDDLLFDEIRSNPPIRIGKQQLHNLLRLWIPRLKPGASAYLVVAKKLGAESLTKWIAETWPKMQVQRVARQSGFHVIQVLNEARA